LKVLVACEFSGVVREAFRKRGHDAYSCDLLPTEIPGKHYQGDVLEILDAVQFDLMIAHPPCTYILNSGCRWLYRGGARYNANGRENEIDPVRWQAMVDGAIFFKKLLNANVPRVCIENPIMVCYAKDIIGVEQSQIIHPWEHGHGELKSTCLWLRGLPLLKPSNIVEGREPKVHFMGKKKGVDRGKERSRTYQGIADAMASQWS